VRLADAFGPATPFVVVAVVLALYAVVSGILLRDAPNRPVAAGAFLTRLWSVARLPATIQCALLYAVGFGGFVAFSVYLPIYLVNAYGLEQQDAALRTAGFVVLAVGMRPVGGWLSDRFTPADVLAVSFAAAAALAGLAAFERPLIPLDTVALLGLGAGLGAASGACFALVAHVAPPDKVGAVTGIVGAAGGLGGFVPPLVMGAIYGWTEDYSIGLALLSAVALACAAFTWLVLRRNLSVHGGREVVA
jgi:NNP family nitrate/nitrite transporter-like MFS transporter